MSLNYRVLSEEVLVATGAVVQVRAEDNVLDEPSLPDKDHGRMTPRRFAQTLADRGQGVPGIELSSQQVADLRQKPPPGLGLFQLVKQPMGLAEVPGGVQPPDDLPVRVGDVQAVGHAVVGRTDDVRPCIGQRLQGFAELVVGRPDLQAEVVHPDPSSRRDRTCTL